VRVLVIDDDREFCDLLARFLRGEGFETDCVFDAAAGLERAVGDRYQIVLLDVMLGRANGFDVLRRIRAASAIPVLMLTGHAYDEHRVRAASVGADGFLPKPVLPDQLAREVRRVLRI